MKTLYHFTHEKALRSIKAQGCIRTTESNIGSPFPQWPPTGEHVGPDVVWLTSEPSPGKSAAGLRYTVEQAKAIRAAGYSVPDKTQIRLTIEVPDEEPLRWRDFAREHGINRKWKRALEKDARPDTWWVLPRLVLYDEIVEVRYMK